MDLKTGVYFGKQSDNIWRQCLGVWGNGKGDSYGCHHALFDTAVCHFRAVKRYGLHYFNRKKVIFIADSTAAITSLLLLLYLMTGRFDFGMICAFTFINATANMLDNNAYQASLSTLVEENDIKKAGGMNQIIDSIGSIIAPVCAGILYYPVGLKGLLVIDLCTFVAAMLIFIRVPACAFSDPDRKKKEHENIFENISAGFRFIFSARGLTLLMIFFAVFNFLLNLSDSMTEPLVLSLVKMAGMAAMIAALLLFSQKDLRRLDQDCIKNS